MSDLGFERQTAFDITVKNEDQTIDDFLKGASKARETAMAYFLEKKEEGKKTAKAGEASKKVSSSKEEEETTKEEKVSSWFDAEKALGPSLNEMLLSASIKMSRPTLAPVLSRAIFVLFADVALKECPSRAPKSLWKSLYDFFYNQRWDFETVQMDNKSLSVYEKKSGLFFGNLRFSLDDGSVLEDVNVQSALNKLQIQFPLPADLADADSKIQGFLLADATFAYEDDGTPTTYTFARRADHKADARWKHHWRLVDVDNIVAQNDWRRFDKMLLGDNHQTTASSKEKKDTKEDEASSSSEDQQHKNNNEKNSI